MRKWVIGSLQQSQDLYTQDNYFTSETMRISDVLSEIQSREWEFNPDWYDRDDNREYHVELIMEMARQAEALQRQLDRFRYQYINKYSWELSFTLPTGLPELQDKTRDQIGWAWQDTAFILLQNPTAQILLQATAESDGNDAETFTDSDDLQVKDCLDAIHLFRQLSRTRQRALMSWAFQFYEDFHTLYTAYNVVFGLLEKMQENNMAVTVE